jgi:hypothetical protein
MKKLLVCVFLTAATAAIADAQTTSGGQSSRNSSQVSGTSTKKTVKATRVQNNRVEYRSKRTGQAGTVTGQDATGTSGSHSNNPKNAGIQNSVVSPGSSTSTNVSNRGQSTKKSKKVTHNNREMYRSKKTGQSATPTGQEATGTNGSHSSNPKNAGNTAE